MEVTYSLEHNDFLTQHLYRITRDKTIQIKRQKQWIILPIVFFAIAAYFYYMDLMSLALAMAFYTIITLLFYRKYFDYKYKNSIEKFVRKNLSKRAGIDFTVNFGKSNILISDETGESKIKNDQVDYIADLPDHFLLHMKVGEVLIIPKNKVDAHAMKNTFDQHKFAVIDESKWKWGQNKYL